MEAVGERLYRLRGVVVVGRSQQDGVAEAAAVQRLRAVEHGDAGVLLPERGLPGR